MQYSLPENFAKKELLILYQENSAQEFQELQPAGREELSLRSRITGTGSYAPKKILDNFDLEKMVDTSDEWITERTGIKERRIADSSEAASDLSVEASKRALQSAGLKPKEIDMIIVATVSGDMPLPSTASFLQQNSRQRTQ